METTKNNKVIVLQFWKNVIGEGNISLGEKLISDNYIQHSAMSKPGKVALIEALNRLKQMPKSENKSKPLMRCIADNDYVALHMLVEFAGRKKLVVDITRISNGLLTEHWDTLEDIPDSFNEPSSLINGDFTVVDLELTTNNREQIHIYCESILIKKQYEKLYDYIDEQVILHGINTKNGISGFNVLLHSFSLQSVHKILVEGNFCLVQMKVDFDNIPTVLNHIYRISNGKIVEQWSVQQSIPHAMPHNNGMI